MCYAPLIHRCPFGLGAAAAASRLCPVLASLALRLCGGIGVYLRTQRICKLKGFRGSRIRPFWAMAPPTPPITSPISDHTLEPRYSYLPKCHSSNWAGGSYGISFQGLGLRVASKLRLLGFSENVRTLHYNYAVWVDTNDSERSSHLRTVMLLVNIHNANYCLFLYHFVNCKLCIILIEI